jgi:hypothetical protein
MRASNRAPTFQYGAERPIGAHGLSHHQTRTGRHVSHRRSVSPNRRIDRHTVVVERAERPGEAQFKTKKAHESDSHRYRRMEASPIRHERDIIVERRRIYSPGPRSRTSHRSRGPKEFEDDSSDDSLDIDDKLFGSNQDYSSDSDELDELDNDATDYGGVRMSYTTTLSSIKQDHSVLNLADPPRCADGDASATSVEIVGTRSFKDEADSECVEMMTVLAPAVTGEATAEGEPKDRIQWL